MNKLSIYKRCWHIVSSMAFEVGFYPSKRYGKKSPNHIWLGLYRSLLLAYFCHKTIFDKKPFQEAIFDKRLCTRCHQWQ